MPKLPKDPRSFFTGPTGSDAGEKVRDQVQRQAGVGPVDGGGGGLFAEPVLVVNQKTKLIELAAEHDVFDQHGNRIGSIVEVDQSQVKMAARLVTSLDQFFTHTFEIRDANEQPLVRLVRPRKLGKSRFELTTADNFVVQIHRPLDDPLRTMVVAAALCIDTALKQDDRGLN